MSNNAPESNLSLDTPPEPCGIRTPETELKPQFFQQVPNVLINDVAKNRLKPLDVVVYIVLKNHLGQNPCTWVSNGTIARLCGVTSITARRSLNNLLVAGHIERRDCHAGHTAKTYLRTNVIDGKVVYDSPRQTPIRPTCAAMSELTATPEPIIPPLPKQVNLESADASAMPPQPNFEMAGADDDEPPF